MKRFAPMSSRVLLAVFAVVGYLWGHGGVCHATEPDLNRLIKSAEGGNVRAQRALGQRFYDGKGTQQDDGKAMHWFRLAADQGDAEAQNSVGTLYDNGKGVPKDYQEAAKWFRLAAHQGHVLARRNLGWMYEKGQGFKKDYVLSYMWQYLAERARTAQKGKPGDGDGRCRLCDAVATKMTPEQVAHAQALAQQWRPGDAESSP